MKKQGFAILLGLLMVLASGCSNGKNNGQVAEVVPQNNEITSSTADIYPSEIPLAGADFMIEDDNVSLEVKLDRNEYDINTVIGMSVDVTNKGDKVITYIKGSGSNVVPEGLKLSLGQLAAMFYPEFSTMDYRIETLNPGETVTFSTPYAPYIYQGADKRSAFGTDKTIEFFQTDEFLPAGTGEVQGSVEFTYYFPDEEASADRDQSENAIFIGIDDAEEITLKGTFKANIIG